VSIHADDEFSLKFAVECELDDVVPRDGLAAVVITRYRRARRRRIAGAVSLVLACAGIGVPLGVLSSGGGAPAKTAASPAMLRLGSFTLTLPGRYRVSSTRTAPCAAAVPPVRAVATVAAASSGGCVVMLLLPSASAGAADGRVLGAREVAVGHYQAWLVPAGYWRDEATSALVIDGSGPSQELVLSASALQSNTLAELAGAGLRS
jgi:hypothetical protein